MQASLRADFKADLKAEISAVKVDLLEHIHGMGAEICAHIQPVDTGLVARLDRIVTKLDRIVAKLDGQCDVLEGALRSSPRAIEWSEIRLKTAK
jgi:hypothetical protein